MTVEELIELLEDLKRPDAEIVVNMYDTQTGEFPTCRRISDALPINVNPRNLRILPYDLDEEQKAYAEKMVVLGII